MGWEVRMSTSKGIPYFLNTETREALWQAPSSLTESQVRQLPGAQYLEGGGGKSGEVRASHLLVKHSGSRRPASWKESRITRSKEEAIGILLEYQKEIRGSSDKFAALATKHSDCSSHEKGGDLGWFGRGAMQKAFEEATYGLEVGEMSDVVSTDSGVHLIMRTG